MHISGNDRYKMASIYISDELRRELARNISKRKSSSRRNKLYNADLKKVLTELQLSIGTGTGRVNQTKEEYYEKKIEGMLDNDNFTELLDGFIGDVYGDANQSVGEESINRNIPTIIAQSLIVPYGKTNEGILVRENAIIWGSIVASLSSQIELCYQLSPEEWEQLIAGAFSKAGYQEVTLTPRSGDKGRDIIAVRTGFGTVKILGSVKAYKSTNLVKYDDIRALAGVLSMDPSASKGMLLTTSDFPPNINNDPVFSSVPTRIELVNGVRLLNWLKSLVE